MGRCLLHEEQEDGAVHGRHSRDERQPHHIGGRTGKLPARQIKIQLMDYHCRVALRRHRPAEKRLYESRLGTYGKSTHRNAQPCARLDSRRGSKLSARSRSVGILRSSQRIRTAERGVVSKTRKQCEYGIGKDRKSTRLNSSHANISYAVFCLKKK